MMRSLFQALRRSERGAAVIELAMIAPILGLMIIGIVDMSNAFSKKLALEQGAQRAIERIMQTTADDTVTATLKDEVCKQVDGIDASNNCKNTPITSSNVTVTYRLECTDAGGTITTQTNTDADTVDTYTCAGGTVSEARYIEVLVTDTYTPLFPIHFSFINGDGTYHLSATAGMRTQ
jgi:Flp pilus assembly protein TadG